MSDRRTSLRRWVVIRAGAVAAVGLVLAGCADVPPTPSTPASGPGATSGPTAASSGPIPLIVDTDMGADDIMAILYILRDPAIDVQAIAVSGTGLAHGNNGAQNLVGLLDAMGRPDIPVAVGRSTPMDGDRPEPFTIAGSIPARFDGATCGGGPPTDIAPGTYTIEAEFTADGESAVVLVRLHPGATWDDLVRYAADASHEALAQPDFIDVVGSVGSSGSGTVDEVVDLEAGLYGFACFSDGSTPIATLAPAPFTVGE